MMPHVREVTALVKTYLRDEYLYNCVKTLRATYPEIKILVCDDGVLSTEKEQKVKQLGANAYVGLKKIVGVTGGRNTLLQLVETPYILVGDDDFSYSDEANVDDLVKLMDIADVACGVVRRNATVTHYEMTFTFNDDGSLEQVPIAGEWFAEFKDIRFTPVDIGFNYFVAKTDAVRAMGGWDETMKVLYEHTDFFLEAKKAKLDVVYCPDAVVDHRVHGICAADSAEYCAGRSSVEDHEAFFKKWGFPYIQMGTRKMYITSKPEQYENK